METPRNDTLKSANRNLRLTRIIVMLAFASNAGLNVLLVGYLARFGGIELVGHWALLGAVMLNVIILDFGSVNALTYRIALDGLHSWAPAIRRLLSFAIGASLIPITIFSWATFLQAALLSSMALAACAALLQLASNWLVSIRMAQQQQYWFNVKTILRVFSQVLSCIFLFEYTDIDPTIALGRSLLIGGTFECALSLVLVAREFSFYGDRASLDTLRKLIVGFGLTYVSQRAYQPISQMLVSFFLGATAIGVFTMGLRIPVMVNQALNEALRVLLPSLAKLLTDNDRELATKFLRDTVAIQLILVVPAGIFLVFHAFPIAGFWLGKAAPDLTIAIQIFSIALIFSAIGAPFHWAVQAGGQAHSLGRFVSIIVGIVIFSGVVLMSLDGNVLDFALMYASGQIAMTAGTLWISERQLKILGGVIRTLKLRNALLHIALTIIVNFILAEMISGMSASLALVVATIMNTVILGPIVLLLLKNKWI